MPLKDKWVDKINDLDYIDANDINEIAHSVIDMEKKSVENVLYTPQTLTDEQKAQARKNIGAMSDNISATIDASVTQYLVDNPVNNGMTGTLRILLQTLFGSAVYTSDQSKNIALLKTVLADQSTESYTVTNVLMNATNNNDESEVIAGNPYLATLTPVLDHALDTVTVTMGGVDITSSVYSDGHIVIPTVSADVVITATAKFDIKYEFNIIKANTNNNFGTPENPGSCTLYGWASDRAMVAPSTYARKNVKYKFSIGAIADSYFYSPVFAKVNTGDIDFSYNGSIIDLGNINIGKLISWGWSTADIEYTVETDDFVMLTVNFKRADNGSVTADDVTTLQENFTITIGE